LSDGFKLVKVELIAVGKELLIGKTVNTNAHWIGGRLARIGGMIGRITTVDDDLEMISSAVRDALGRRPDFLVSVGGLGPTPDDMTLQGIAMAMGRRLVLNRDAMRMVRGHYIDMRRGDLELTRERRKMAMLPKGSTPLRNQLGTAPGVRLESGRVVIFCLPGVPKEMKFIFRDSAEKEIRKKMGALYSKKVVMNLEGIFESTLAPLIKEALKRYPDSYIKSHPKGVEEGVSRIELDIVTVARTSKRADRAEATATMMKEKIARAGGVVLSMKSTSYSPRMPGRRES
jgi:molybdenum cofactor synthesis domain-containing protein